MDIEATLEKHLGPVAHALNGLPDQLAARDDSFLRELTRGIKYMRQAYVVTPAAAQFQIPGPDLGFAWDIRLITGTLSASDSVAAYVGETANNLLIGYAPAPGAAPAQAKFVINPSGRSAILNPGEPLFIQTSGTGNISRCMVAAIQVPAEMLGKIIV